MNYYKNFKSDEASSALSIILNSGYMVKENTTRVGCNCNDSISSSNEISKSCFDLYSEGMYNWLLKMLGDKSFYEDWFRIYMNEDDYIPNDVLIENLKTLFNEFLKLQYSLSFLPSKYAKNCECPAVSFDENECNYNIIKNYMKILEWVFDDELDANVNKIKIYGSKFSELLVKLQF